MSIPEEVGKVASSAIDAMRGNPLCLAVVVLSVILSVIAFARERHSQDERGKVITELVERCMEPAKR
jgi:hypothetical protein